MEAQQAQPRGRILIAAVGAAVALAAIIAIVAIASGGESEECASSPRRPRCVDAWNADEAARAYGRHNFSFHLYEGALVTFLSRGGEQVGEGEGGLCAVIFPSQALDPEPFAPARCSTGRAGLRSARLPGSSSTAWPSSR